MNAITKLIDDKLNPEEETEIYIQTINNIKIDRLNMFDRLLFIFFILWEKNNIAMNHKPVKAFEVKANKTSTGLKYIE